MVDGINSNNAIGWSSTRDLYNGVEGNKDKFIEIFSKTITHTQETTQEELDAHAAKVYDYMQSLDKDDKQGLTREEYAAGLEDKLRTSMDNIDALLGKFVDTDKLNDFLNMNDVDKLKHIKNNLPEAQRANPAEADMIATKALAEINQKMTEASLVMQELDTVKVELDTAKEPKKADAEKRTAGDILSSGFLADFRNLSPEEQAKVMKELEKLHHEEESNHIKNHTTNNTKNMPKSENNVNVENLYDTGKKVGEKTAEYLENQKNPPIPKDNENIKEK